MAYRDQIILYTNQLLEIDKFQDYCPNGLQVEGKTEIKKIISGVTASLALLNKAVENNADMILVHHGYFWKGETPEIVGMKKNRLQSLLKHDINLVAYHLPLDAHPIYGNNALLGQTLGIEITARLNTEVNPNMIYLGEFTESLSIDTLEKLIQDKLQRPPLIEKVNAKPIKTIAWCTGAAQDYIFAAIEQQCDAFLTGEVSERTIHIARENNIDFIAAGHHATEKFGVQALGEHLAQHFNCEHEFIDIENPA